MSPPAHINGDRLTNKERQLGPQGWAFLGRDKNTWGDEGTGLVAIDPDAECSLGSCPHYNDQEHDSFNDSIHLTIAAFRDRLCPRTLYNLFHKAANPKRIYVRIIQQVMQQSDIEDDADCWQQFCKNFPQTPCQDYTDQVKVWTMNAKIAQGPTDPRSKLSALLEYDHLHPNTPVLKHVAPTDYCMQTDSHMDFTQDFDKLMIDMFHRTKNDYAVLSTYVAPTRETDKFPKEVPHLCMVEFTSTWRNWGTKYCLNLLRPKLTNIPWGAGLSFQKCHADLNVPYDPYLPNIFDGEELSRGVRFFTHGYDMYTPDQVLVTHDYEGHQHNPNVHSWGTAKARNRIEESDWRQDEELTKLMKPMTDSTVNPQGVNRINIMMGIERASEALHNKIAQSRYGLGDRRSIEQAIEFSGFDPKLRKMVKNNCGNVAWVPFEEVDHQWGLSKNLQRPIWDEKVKPVVDLHPDLVPASDRSSKSPENTPAVVQDRQLRTARPNKTDSGHRTLSMLGFCMVLVALFGSLIGKRKWKPRKAARLVV
jgi:hypothetical protein